MKSIFSMCRNSFCLLLAFVMVIFTACNSDKKILSNATELIGEKTPVASFQLAKNKAGKVFGTMEFSQIDHSNFDTAAIITCNQLTIMDWDLLVTCPVKQKLAKGDIVYLEFYGKVMKPKPGTNIGQVLFKYPSMVFSVLLDSVWNKFSTYAVIKSDTDPTDLRIHCSFEPQSIALGGIKMYRFGPEQDISSFKDLTPLYESDGIWEKDADKRIDSLRKGTAEFILKDENGNPLPGYDYTVEMTQHAFKFGTAVSAPMFSDTSSMAEKYRKYLKQDFNHVVIDHHMKWIAWKDPEERKHLYDALKWLKNNQFEIRGHCLVWPWFDFQWKLPEVDFDTLKLKKAVIDHVVDEATAMRGKLVDWDVLNEPFVIRDTNGVWLYCNAMDMMGQEEVIKWYMKTHEIDPNIRMFINDFDMVSDGANFELHKQDFEGFIDILINNKVPLGGIGFQGHFEGYLTRPQKVMKVLNRFSRFGLPILITEYDAEVSNGHDETSYLFTHDFLKTCFSHPNVNGFLNWGFWAGNHWRPETAFYDTEWNLRPAGRAWKDLVYSEWWTRISDKTDGDGYVMFRGFLGDYKISFIMGDKKVEKNFRLKKDGITWL